MARLVVKFGAAPNDKTGDSARTGAQKINSTFVELYSFLSGGESTDVLPVALPLSRGGTGASTVEGARRNLGLGDSATRGVGTNENDIMVIGTCGFGTDLSPLSLDVDGRTAADYMSGELLYANMDDVSAITLATRTATTKGQVGLQGIGKISDLVLRESKGQGFTRWYKQFGETNSTVTVNGNIKACDNSARITWQTCTTQHGDVLDFVREGVGVYLITGAQIETTRWTKEVPLDANDLPMFVVSFTTLGTAFKVTVTKDGQPFEIPQDLWIDVHLKI